MPHDRLKNKFTNCKGIRNNTGSRQTTGIQEELDTTCKQNASRQTTQDNETLFPNWQKESWQTSEEPSRYVRPERVNKWPNSMTHVRWWWWWCRQCWWQYSDCAVILSPFIIHYFRFTFFFYFALTRFPELRNETDLRQKTIRVINVPLNMTAKWLTLLFAFRTAHILPPVCRVDIPRVSWFSSVPQGLCLNIIVIYAAAFIM